jgi:metal-responsive CopG/Arc/MetJ family transcriptional regulator
MMLTKAYSITEELIAQLEEVSARDDRSMSNIVRAAIREYMVKVNRPTPTASNGADHDRS